MSEHSRDDELLKAFLSGDSELSRRYREMDAEEPPAHVDAAIIASARWAVGADRNEADRTSADRKGTDSQIADRDVSAGKTQSDRADKINVRQRNFLAHWRIPLATAALVVIAATLTLMIERSPENDGNRSDDDVALLRDLGLGEPQSAEQVPEQVAAKSAASARTTPGKQPAKTESAKTEAVKRQAVSTSETAKQTTKQAATLQAAPKPAAPKSPAPKPTTPKPPAPASANTQSGKDAGAAPAAAPKEERAAAAVVAGETEESKPQAAVAPGPATAQQPARSLDEQAGGETASGRDSDAAVASYAGATFPGAGDLGTSSGERLDQPSALADVSTPAETKQPASANGASEAEQTVAGASEESVQTGSADLRDPQQWIKDINDLLAQGKRAQAIDSLKAFRRKYPDYQLTPELRALLPADPQ